MTSNRKEVKFLNNVNPLKKMGILSHGKKDQKHNSPHKVNGVVKFKTKEGEYRPGELTNGDVLPSNSDVRRNNSDQRNGNATHLNNRCVCHGNQLSHVGSERRKWFVAKPSRSLGKLFCPFAFTLPHRRNSFLGHMYGHECLR